MLNLFLKKGALVNVQDDQGDTVITEMIKYLNLASSQNNESV